MPYAILSDIHGNLEALDAVLADVAPRADELSVLGDVVGYGADPDRVHRACRRARAVVVAGNHEHGVAGLLAPTGSTTGRGRRPSGRGGGSTPTTSPGWPRGRRRGTGRRHARACLARASGGVGLRASPRRTATRSSPRSTTRVCFVGHSHRRARGPWARVAPDEPGARDRPRVGPALPGQRRQRRTAARRRSARGLRRVGRRRSPGHASQRVPYDLATARRKILRAGLPRFLAERLSIGA